MIVGVDTGGTFTDLVSCDPTGAVVEATKVSTTPEDPSKGILTAFAMLTASEVDAFLHGTTTGTNALLERRGARTALLTTRGFRDILEIARQARPNLYDWFQRKPEPLVSRELTLEVEERTGPHEAARKPLDERAARSAVAELRNLGVEAVAVSLLHSYKEPEHEVRLGVLLAEELPGVHVSLSSDVLPEIMEYERTSTTVANAYIAPVMEGYLRKLVVRLSELGLSAPVYVMQSNGGLASAEAVERRAVQTVLSGPAAGVIGGLASTSGSSKGGFLTIDMGGTSFDVAYADGREATISRETLIDGLPLAVPALDIHTLGAGGGSIAWIDRGEALRIGPASAGSVPGPACYGRGGDDPTVTDANAVLGRIGPNLLGGRLALDLDAAHRAIERRIADPLGLSVVDAARGIIRIVNAAMAKGMHLMSIARGRDPRILGVVGFGGAGPLHACELAALIGSDEVIIPILPGNTSALGLVLADVRHERSVPILAPLASVPDDEARALLADASAKVVAQLREDGVRDDAIRLGAVARISYEGQRYQLQVPLSVPGGSAPGLAFSGSLASAADTFRQRHLASYGYIRSEPLSLFSLDVVGLAQMSSVRAARLKVEPSLRDGGMSRRNVWFANGCLEATVYPRSDLGEGRVVSGPALIEQDDTTTLVPPGWAGTVDPHGNLLLRRAE